jgi:hypothetical protein
MKTTSKQKERVKIEDLGLLTRTIEADYNPKNNKEMAELISEHFNVICEESDIEEYLVIYEHYEELLQCHEDFELESRRHRYFQSINKSNPFY